MIVVCKPEQEGVPEGGWLQLQPHEQLSPPQSIQKVVYIPADKMALSQYKLGTLLAE